MRFCILLNTIMYDLWNSFVKLNNCFSENATPLVSSSTGPYVDITNFGPIDRDLIAFSWNPHFGLGIFLFAFINALSKFDFCKSHWHPNAFYLQYWQTSVIIVILFIYLFFSGWTLFCKHVWRKIIKRVYSSSQFFFSIILFANIS